MRPSYEMKTYTRKRSLGFTLVEMLIVAALISLFSAIAIFSISTQLNLNKAKAATAECRNISTALSFAQQDLGFFPKLCFLRMSSAELVRSLSNYNRNVTGQRMELEVYSRGVGTGVNDSTLLKKWKGPYGGFGQDRICQMSVPAESGGTEQQYGWPADPWGSPYTTYFVRLDMVDPSGGGQRVPNYRFTNSAGENANYFAGVVSYGRNKVPGMRAPGEAPADTDSDAIGNYQDRLIMRLYKDDPRADKGPNSYIWLTAAEFSAGGERVRMITSEPTLRLDVGGGKKEPPRIRDPYSDDRLAEF